MRWMQRFPPGNNATLWAGGLSLLRDPVVLKKYDAAFLLLRSQRSPSRGARSAANFSGPTVRPN
jgi:hypothetical protein